MSGALQRNIIAIFAALTVSVLTIGVTVSPAQADTIQLGDTHG